MANKENPKRKLAMLLSKSKLSAFLDESVSQAEQEVAQENIVRQLQLAASQKSTVVLRLQEDNSDIFETVSGWVASKTVGKEHVMLKVAGDQQQIRMIPIPHIKKISMLSPNGERHKASK
ncbi:hypothetical protein [Enterococcus sp. HY326]|uniref:hypothetical protein n=1 Tax=Enterococcus sp. HY326 TaxID=2971265 RepID=UPI0022401DE4|nr:hypothetical protein [Enterococcus sp. HY326]